MSGTEQIFRGIAASPGIAVGHVLTAVDPLLITFQFKLRAEQVRGEIARFMRCVERSRDQIRKAQAELDVWLGRDSAFLIDSHLLMLEDRMLIDRVVEKIETEQINAEWAIQQVCDAIYEAFGRVHDDYLRERRGDIEDIARRLQHNLAEYDTSSLKTLRHDTILAGKTIPPSALVELRSPKVVGLVSETGGPLSHTAIMARSLEIPAVMGVQDLWHKLASGELVVIDGNEGIVIRSPERETLRKYRRRAKQSKKIQRAEVRSERAPCVTEDGLSISLGANINFAEEVKAALNHGCEAVGLYRTEFDFFRDGEHPEEDRLVADYTMVLDSAKSVPVTFRTIDVGIDQQVWDGDTNPNFGVRGLRFCLKHPDVFKKQLRAIYRASVHGHARIVLPFVSTVDEVDAALEILKEVRRHLDRRHLPYDASVPIGVMIETPAAAQTCDLMASRVDFFCLGTNDLIQYYLVVGRADKSVQHLYNQLHPAILRCLRQVRALLEPAGKPVVVCGEMAADPPSAAVLLGLGFTAFSVSLSAYPKIKRVIRSLSMAKLRELAARLLEIENPRQVEQQIRAALGDAIW